MHELIRNAAWVLSFLAGFLWMTIGLLFARIGWSTLRKWFVSARWPKVPARIVASEVKADGRLEEQGKYQPIVRYVLVAEGQAPSDNQFAFVGKFYASRSRARREIDKYPVGMLVMVRCHPQDPANVVFERSGMVIGLSLLLLGLSLTAAPLALAGWFGLPVWPPLAIVGTVAAFVVMIDRSSRRRPLRLAAPDSIRRTGRGATATWSGCCIRERRCWRSDSIVSSTEPT
jgi:hypothetical protein